MGGVLFKNCLEFLYFLPDELIMFCYAEIMNYQLKIVEMASRQARNLRESLALGS